MTPLDYAALEAKVHAMADAGGRGHLHTTPPGCLLTSSPQRAIVVEATDEGQVYAYFDDDPIESRARPLAILLHGAESVPDPHEALEPASDTVEAMAARMREGRGHFHILNPVCLSNPHPGRWTILFEDDERGPQYRVTDERPLADIRLIERLIYAQPKAE